MPTLWPRNADLRDTRVMQYAGILIVLCLGVMQ